MSPGFTSRPSLSAQPVGVLDQDAGVSPGFTSRPSLSVLDTTFYDQGASGVAGIHVPAFVERGWTGEGLPAGAACRRDSRPGLR